jgi:hypothetical protein
VRRDAARDHVSLTTSEIAADHWRAAEQIRREWLAHGLATQPADRSATEDVLAGIYARHSRPRPRFVWVDSPQQAVPILAGLPTHASLQQWVWGRRPTGAPPVASDIGAGLSRLRSALDECFAPSPWDSPAKVRKGGPPESKQKEWPVLPPLDALGIGVPLREVLRQGVRAALETSLADGFYRPIRAVLATGAPLPVAWYGQQDSHWIAYYDVLRRLGLARYRSADDKQFDEWATLARSCGWWWPGEEQCVVVERPAVIRTRPVESAWHEQVRLDHSRGPAVEYRDGWRPIL